MQPSYQPQKPVRKSIRIVLQARDADGRRQKDDGCRHFSGIQPLWRWGFQRFRLGTAHACEWRKLVTVGRDKHRGART